VIEDRGGRVPDLEEDLEEAGLPLFRPDPPRQPPRGRERGEGTVDDPDDLAEDDRVRRPAKGVSALAPPPARDDPRVLQEDQDALEELLGDPSAAAISPTRTTPSPFRSARWQSAFRA